MTRTQVLLERIDTTTTDRPFFATKHCVFHTDNRFSGFQKQIFHCSIKKAVMNPEKVKTQMLQSRKKVTLIGLAKHAGVSVRTLSRYFKDNNHVSKRTRNQIQATVEKLNYRPSAIARSLRTQKAMSIGLAL